MSAGVTAVVGAGVARGTRRRVAGVLSELFAPWVGAAVLPPVVGAAAGRPWWRGGLPGVLTSVSSAGIPYLLVLRGVRRGWLSDRHVSRRADRPRLLGVTVGFVAVALVLVRLLGGPAQLVALVVAVGWARVVVRVHTPAQVVAGAVVGAAITGAVLGAA